MSEKIRLDSALFEKGIAESREKAKAYIMSGQVYVNGIKILKSGTFINEKDEIEFRGNKMPFVSRGGYKLQKAVDCFGVELNDTVCMDIGASTGGFTDCMLQHGAKKVYAIDVGYGQLAWKLRTDERVINLERTNFRYVTENEICEPVDFASVDVSFISLKIILPVLRERLREKGQAVCLIKPQFEAGKENVGKKGVVRDKSVHCEVLGNILSFAVDSGFSVLNVDYSPIKGPEGNIEYLMLLEKTDDPQMLWDGDYNELVDRSHENLDK